VTVAEKVRSLTTWLWLIDIEDGAHALDASAEVTGDLAASLRGHFANVHVLRRDQDSLARVRASSDAEGWPLSEMAVGSAQTAPWAPATFSCIVLHDALVRQPAASSSLVDDLRHYHKMLKPGGWLALTSPQPFLPGRSRDGQRGVSRHRFRRFLKTAGFREVRCLFSEFTLERPLFLVPNDHTLISAYEASDAMRGTARWTRRLVASVGLRAVLYPAYLLLARA
jgi:SAM-dependent methyltransferase